MSDRPSGTGPPMPERPPTGPANWVGSQLRPEQWTRPLTDRQLNDLLRLAQRCDLSRPDDLVGHLTGTAQTNGSAAIPSSLQDLARHISDDLLRGLGFTVVTGLPVADLDPETTAAAYITLGRLLGGLRSQNAEGHLLGHVRNVGADPAIATTRIYQTDRRQTFHTDSCDAVGLLCLTPAAEGGQSLLVSAEAAYQEMHRRRPDLAARLFQPVATDRRGEIPPGQKPWFEIPVMSWHRGLLTVLYQRQYIDSARRFHDAPVPDDEQLAALDLFDAVLDDPALHLSLEFQPGDMQFVNNHSLLHDRTGFVDTPGRPRHLLRLWLTLPGGRALPPVFTQRYGTITVGDRGGIVTAETRASISL